MAKWILVINSNNMERSRPIKHVDNYDSISSLSRIHMAHHGETMDSSISKEVSTCEEFGRSSN